MHNNLVRLFHSLNGVFGCLPPNIAVKLQSQGRAYFMDKFYQTKLANPPIYINNQSLSRTLWGIYFRLPILNSAGMFKNGEAYDFVASLGAGGYIGGTSTYNHRIGNIKLGIKHPFISLPKSQTSINFLGLPNVGDKILSKKQLTYKKVDGCPIGWSVMRSADFNEVDGLNHLITSLRLFEDNTQIDFIEINESCPNVGAGFSNLESRLRVIADNFLAKRKRHLPVIVKLSNDISITELPQLIDILVKYKFDGLNIGNTSTRYADIVESLHNNDKKLFTWFTSNIGGGVGGEFLKSISLELCAYAVDYVNQIKPNYEFHIIRAGGINSIDDLIKSNEAGVSLNQWYTGFFTNYIEHGYNTYKNLYS